LSLLTGCVGARKPVAFIEDAAVRPAQLPEYVRGLQAIMHPLGLEASYYGHAASGLLHVRPVLDLHRTEDLKKFRQVADQTSALVKEFKGSLSAEHGVGIARTEYMREQLGDELLGAMREIKRIFDPRDRMNPGKIFGTGNFRIDSSLRENFTRPIELPFTPRLAFAFKDHSFIGNLEQCNGCGGCRKDAPTMCPTFLATGEEVMSTRGRANIIRAALEMRVNGHDPLRSAELDAALSNCLSCKGCTPECPSNVNLALLKAEAVTPVPRSTIAATTEARSSFGTIHLCVITNRTLELPQLKCWKRSGLKLRSRKIGNAAAGRHSAKEISIPPRGRENIMSV